MRLILPLLCSLFILSCTTEPSTSIQDIRSTSGVDYKLFQWENHGGMCGDLDSFPTDREPSLLVAVKSDGAVQQSMDQLVILWSEESMVNRLVADGNNQAYKSPKIEFRHALAQHSNGQLFYMYTERGASKTTFAEDLVAQGAVEAILLPTGVGPNFVKYANAPINVQRDRLALPGSKRANGLVYLGVFPKGG